MSNLPQIGIDIGTSATKIVELLPNGRNEWKLSVAASMPTPGGGVVGNISNLAPMIGALSRLVKESGIRSRRAVAAMPEEQISSHIVEMPTLSDSEIEQALQWQVEQYIPIPQDQAIWSHKVIRSDPAGGSEVLLVAAAKNLVEAYKTVLEQAGLEVVALETELMAVARSVVVNKSPLSVVADIGSHSTDLGIVRDGELIFARTIPTAGEAFTRSIESSLKLDPAQAAQYLNTYGFSGAHLDGQLLEAVKPVLNVIATEIKKTIDFYVSKHAGETVKLVMLSGGVAVLPEVVGVLSSQIGLETVVGDPFSNVKMDEAQRKALIGNGPFYSVAVGLAKRE